MRALNILMFGAPNFFVPRMPPPLLWPTGNALKASYYDNSPLRATLERLVDFDRINAGLMRFSVGAVNVRTGNFAYFDSSTDRIRAEHVLASGSLPPGFPATEVDGEHYWDGGLISNTPLQWVLDSRPRLDTLAFQVDLWSARGKLPKRSHRSRSASQGDRLFEPHPRGDRPIQEHAEAADRGRQRHQAASGRRCATARTSKILQQEADDKVCNIAHLIYRARSYEGIAKDFEFSRRTMEEHWQSGYDNARRTLANPEVMRLPDRAEGVRTFDMGRE